MPALSNEITAYLAYPRLRISAADARRVLRDLYQLDGQVETLVGEADNNFRVQTGDATCLLKIARGARSPDSSIQVAALRHIERSCPGLRVPRILSSVDGDDEVAITDETGEAYVACLMTFLPGLQLSRSEQFDSCGPFVGVTLAQLDRAMASFNHPGVDRDILWDTTRVPRIKELLSTIDDIEKREAVASVLHDFNEHVTPAIPILRKQAIHNDLNPHNLLVETGADGVTLGVIDFGDVIRAPLINDLATAIAYRSFRRADPFTILSEVVAGYHSVLQLEAVEFALLLDIVRARQALVISITAWRSALHPSDSAYISRNTNDVWTGLQRLLPLSRAEVADAIQLSCSR
jgi:Ser/Thr protein kinase RdoA (MazF antagonist)